jgi:hypothetical protein
LSVESRTVIVGNVEIPIKTDLSEAELMDIIVVVEGKLKETSNIIDRKKQLILVAMSIAGDLNTARKEIVEKEENLLQVEEKTDTMINALTEM